MNKTTFSEKTDNLAIAHAIEDSYTESVERTQRDRSRYNTRLLTLIANELYIM